VGLRDERESSGDAALDGPIGDVSAAYTRAVEAGEMARGELAEAKRWLRCLEGAEREIGAAAQQEWWIADQVAWRYGLLPPQEVEGAGWNGDGEQLVQN
jgi:hypothetical protein